MRDVGLTLQRELGWGTLTYELRRRGEPLREWFEDRFPHKVKMFEDVRQAAGRHIAVAPLHHSCQTVGWAFELVLRFMLDPCAHAQEAYSGIAVEVLRDAVARGHRGEELSRIRREWTCMADRAVEVAGRQLNYRFADEMESGVERALQACWVLALLIEFSRNASLEQSVLATLRGRPTLDAASKLAPQLVIDDLYRLYHQSSRHIERLVDRGVIFAPDLESPIEAVPDAFLGRSVLEIKCCAGRRRSPSGAFSYGLKSTDLFQMIGYGLLASDSCDVDGIALFNPRWDLLLEWSLAEVCDRAGLPGATVDRLTDELGSYLLGGKPQVR